MLCLKMFSLRKGDQKIWTKYFSVVCWEPSIVAHQLYSNVLKYKVSYCIQILGIVLHNFLWKALPGYWNSIMVTWSLCTRVQWFRHFFIERPRGAIWKNKLERSHPKKYFHILIKSFLKISKIPISEVLRE